MKVLCIVQARMGSERLPGKVLKPILGQPMILYTLNRLKKCKYLDEIVLATSSRNSEEPLVNVVKSSGFKVFKGDENNVLKRYVDTYKEHGGDIIVRVTGDCPLIDPQIVDNIITYYEINDFDYVRLDVPETFVRGFDVEVFSSKVLLNVYEQVSLLKGSDRFKEHVTLYIYENSDRYKVGYVRGNEFYNKNYRLCVDTLEDFKLVEQVFSHFKDEYVSGKDVIKYLDNNSDIASININIEQKKV